MRDRPRGVSVLCLLQLLVATGMLGVFCIGGTFLMDFDQQMADYLPASPRTLVALMMLFGYVYLFAAFGMFTGRKWGWWLGVLIYAAIASTNLLVIVQMARMHGQIDLPIGELQFLYAKIGARAVFALMILVYLFQEHVREFYRLEHRSPYFDFAAIAGSTAMVNVGVGFASSLL